MARQCVLMYHGLAEDGSASSSIGTCDPVYTISPETFQQQMGLLELREYSGRCVRDTVFGNGGPSRSVTLTFDDGNQSDVLSALPVLNSHGFTATFYITTAWIGEPGFLTSENIRTLFDSGMEIGSHGHTHRYFSDLSHEELREEIDRSVEVLAAIVEDDITALGLPGGRSHDALQETARAAGIQTIGTSRVGLFDPAVERYCIPRIAVTRSVTDREFLNMIAGHKLYFSRKRSMQALLDTAKRMLGSSVYDYVRSALVRR